MPRSARQMSSSGIYHIILRGVNKQTIFADNEDNESFLRVLSECKMLSGFEVYGYCLMGNHVHLLLKQTEENIGQLMKRIASRYVKWFNWKYDRCGHLFQERYKSEAVEDDRYFVALLRYIHQNPKRAGICEAIGEYKWSSYNDYFHRKSTIVDLDLALGIIGESYFESFMNEDKEESFMEYSGPRKRLADDKLAAEIESMCGLKAITIQNESRERIIAICREALKIEGVSTRQLSRVTGVSAHIIWHL